MKIYPLLALCLSSYSLLAQVFPQLAEHPNWEVKYYYEGEGNITENYYPGQIASFEDNSWIEILHDSQSDQTGSSPVDSLLVGHYRVDGSRVYFRESGLFEGLLYDFSVQAGDTVRCLSPFSSGMEITYQVLGVDTFYCNGLPKRRIHVSCQFFIEPAYLNMHETYWIEGFGDRKHPFPNLFCLSYYCPIYYHGNILSLPGGTIDNQATVPCLVPTAVTDLSPSPSFSLYPNPIPANQSVVQISGLAAQRHYTIQLVQLNGQIIRKWEVIPGSDPSPLTLPDLSPDMYWLFIQDEQNGKQALSFVIM